MTARTRTAASWLLACAWAAVRLAFPPPGHNTHTIMYPLVEAAGSYNTLEPFHPLYHPVVAACRWAWESFGGTGPALPLLQLVSLLAGMANILLMFRLARRLTGKDGLAAGAALLTATGQNLWAWSLMTTSYTLSTAFIIAAADAVLGRGRLAWKDWAWAGLLAGTATAFDTAAGLIAIPMLWDARRSRKDVAAFGGGMLAVLSLSYVLLVDRLWSLGWPFPPTLQGFVGSLPRDLVPLWESHDLLGQVRAFFASEAPLDFVWLVAVLAVFAYPRDADRRAWRCAVLLYAAFLAFFFINDPHNRFLYAGATLMPLLFVTSFPERWAAVAAGALLFNLLNPPRYAPEKNPAFAEAEWLAERLGPRDLLVSLSDPDWLLGYGLMGRVPVLKLARPGDEAARFGQRVAPEPAAEKLLDATLCAGGRALFAPDALYRSALLDPAALDAGARRLVSRWQERYAAGAALVSPQGQHYMPLEPRPGFCAKEGGRGVPPSPRGRRRTIPRAPTPRTG